MSKKIDQEKEQKRIEILELADKIASVVNGKKIVLVIDALCLILRTAVEEQDEFTIDDVFNLIRSMKINKEEEK